MKKFRISMRKVFFLKSLIKNLLLLMIPFITIFSYSLYRTNREIQQTLEARNRNLLTQFQTQVDSFFNTANIVANFLTQSPSANNVIVSAFQDENLDDSTIKQMNNLSRYLQSIIVSNSFSHSCYLYFDNQLGRYISTSNGLSYIKLFSDEDWMIDFLNMEDDLWCTKEKINIYSSVSTTDVITIYKKIYSPYTTTAQKGILITNFSSDILNQYINEFVLYSEQSLLLFQKDGNILFQNTKEDFINLWAQISDYINNEQYINVSTKYKQRDYNVSIMKSSEYDLYCVSIIPMDNIYAQSHSITDLFIIISIASLLVSIIISLLSANHDYKQLQNIIEKFNNENVDIDDSSIALSNRSDPYQIILDNVINLYLEQHKLQMKIINNQYQIELLELKALHHQINPHFMFNTLNTIYWEAIQLSGSPNKCSQMITDLSDIMLYTLEDIHTKKYIHDELKYLLHYTNIQSIRYQNKIKVKWDVDKEILNCLIIKMALQPLIENSIYHGLKEKSSSGTIKIIIKRNANDILIKIIDNGLGMTDERLKEIKDNLKNDNYMTSHIGVYNTNRRLVLTYGNKSSLKLNSWRGKGTIVSFIIPIEEDMTC